MKIITNFVTCENFVEFNHHFSPLMIVLPNKIMSFGINLDFT